MSEYAPNFQKNPDIDQDLLLKKLAKYLEFQKEEKDRKEQEENEQSKYKNVDEVISSLKIGHCSGLVALWLYLKHRGMESKFKEELELICGWDENPKSLGDEAEDKGFLSNVFERFLNEMIWAHGEKTAMMQHKQKDLQKIFDVLATKKYRTPKGYVDPKTGKPKAFFNPGDEFQDPVTGEFLTVPEQVSAITEEFNMAFLFKKNELITTLKQVVPENKMVRIVSTNHATGVMKIKEKYHIYDPNSKKGPIVCNDPEAIAAHLEKMLFTDFDVYCEHMPINIRVFRGSDQEPSVYPNSYDLITEFLANDPNIERTFWDNRTLESFVGRISIIWDRVDALEFSVSEDDEGSVSAILEWDKILKKQGETAGIDINKEGKSKQLLLMRAVMNKNENMVRILLKNGADINAKNSLDQTPLIKAIEEGDGAGVSMLLKNGADVNIENPIGLTPLMIAVANGNKEVVHLLLEKNAEINPKTRTGSTPLMIALLKENEAMMDILLEKNADVNAKDFLGQTLLMMATEKQNETMVRLLLEKNADVNAKSRTGKTSLMKAAENGNSEIIRMLLEKRADVNMVNRAGETPLRIAKEKGNEAAASVILSYINAKNEEDSMSFMLAIKDENEKDILRLLKNGAYVDAKDISSFTPLMFAIEFEKESMVRLLSEHGADLKAKNKWNETPLMMAERKGNKEIIDILKTAEKERIIQPLLFTEQERSDEKISKNAGSTPNKSNPQQP